MKIGNYLVYQAHTNPDFYNELIFSIYSFKRFHSESKIQIIVYIDNETYLREYLKEFDILYLPFDKEFLSAKKNENIHDVKINLLKDATSRFNGNFLFVNTDTFFVNHCVHLFQQIHAGRLLLHAFDSKLLHFPSSKSLLNKRILIDEKEYLFHKELEIWNTGVIGISSHRMEVLHHAASMKDKVYEICKHKASEQLAISLVFQNAYKLVNCDYAIFQYRNLEELRPELNRLLSKPEAKSYKYLVELVRMVNPILVWRDKQEWKRKNRFRMPILRLFDIRYRPQPIKVN